MALEGLKVILRFTKKVLYVTYAKKVSLYKIIHILVQHVNMIYANLAILRLRTIEIKLNYMIRLIS